MVVKVKEISIGRGRKYSQNYQSVDYHVGITIEGTAVKDTVEDMIKRAVSELASLEIGEQSRCRDVIDIIGLEEDREFKEAVDNVAKTLPEPQFNKENLEISEEVLMDLKEVTVMVMTEKAVLFTKKGFQKWVPLSAIESGVPLGEGKYLKDIELTPNGEKWIHEKSWDKLVVKK